MTSDVKVAFSKQGLIEEFASPTTEIYIREHVSSIVACAFHRAPRFMAVLISAVSFNE